MKRSTFVLISGAWHGSWCWHKIVPRLHGAGHSALAPDLPGYGADRTPAAAVTLETWTRSVCQLLEACPEPVVLVGHSRGGIVISRVAETIPHKVRELVYVSGFLLRRGESLLRMLQDDGTSPLLRHATLAEKDGRWVVAEAAVREIFYGECTEEDVALARSKLAPEPAAPLMSPVRITESNFGRVPRTYIECLHDNAIPHALQRRMYTASPCSKVLSLATDHSPFFSSPDLLTAHLLSLTA
jgi:pimeloyl-ACP methyl ester carboxylesterase